MRERVVVVSFKDVVGLGDFANGVGRCSAYMTKLCGVFGGFQYTRRLGFRIVKVNMNSLVATNYRLINID